MIDLSHVLALREPDVARRRAVLAALEQDNRQVTRVGEWVVAVSAVSGVPRPDLWALGLFFAEGQDQVGALHPPAEWLERAWSGDLAPLPSDFTFLALRPDGESAVAVSSVAGVVPLYYWASEGRVAVGSRLGDFVRFGPRESRLDPEATAIALTMMVWPGNRSFLSGVRVLGRGARLSFTPPLRPAAYWDWRTADALPRAEFVEATRKLRSVVLARLDRALPASGTLITVSGGVDSSILAAVSTRVLGRRISTLTSLPTGSASEREWAYVNTLFRWTGDLVERRFIRCRTNGERLAVLAASTPRVTPSANAARAEQLLDLRRAVRVDVFVGGEYADQWFGAHNLVDDWMSALRPADLLRRPSLLPLIARNVRPFVRFRELKASGRMPLSVLRPALHLLPPDKLRAHEEYVHGWQRDLAGCPRGAFPLRLERAHYLTAQTWESLASIGVAPCYPFLGREVLELALRLSPVENARLRGSKRVLRAAFSGDLPRMNLQRPDKGHYPSETPDVRWMWPIPGDLAGVVRPDWIARPPALLPETTALHLRGLLNMVEAVRIERSRVGDQ